MLFAAAQPHGLQEHRVGSKGTMWAASAPPELQEHTS